MCTKVNLHYSACAIQSLCSTVHAQCTLHSTVHVQCLCYRLLGMLQMQRSRGGWQEEPCHVDSAPFNCQVNWQLTNVNCEMSTVKCQLWNVNCEISTANCQLSLTKCCSVKPVMQILIPSTAKILTKPSTPTSKQTFLQFDIGQVLVEEEEECRAEHSGLQQIIPISEQVLATPRGNLAFNQVLV